MSDERKRPARRTTKKRKAAASAASLHDDDGDGAGFLLSGQNPKDLARKMLAWIPQDASIKHKDAKKLLKSFDLVRAELQHRANCMSVHSIESGEKSDVLLSGVSVPSTIMQNILEFVPRPHTVKSASLVSKPWLAIIRAPEFWQVLDHSSGLREASATVSNMTDLLKLLRRPQFSSLRTLVPPNKVQNRKKAMEQIAKACPMLEELDLGVHFLSHMKIDDATLLSIPNLFPHLKSVRFNTYRITNACLKEFCQMMGSRLVDLAIYETTDYVSDANKLSNELLASIGSSCPQLQHFYVHFEYQVYGFGLEEGLIDLLKNCSQLKSLRLVYCNNLGPEVFQYIVDSSTITLERLLVSGHENLMGNQFLCADLESKVSSFEVMSSEELVERNRELARQGHTKNSYYW